MGSSDLTNEVFAEEYLAFLHMGMSQQEIARSFRMSMDTLNHRISRSGLIAFRSTKGDAR